MSDKNAKSNAASIVCPRCHKEFPVGTDNCPDDGTPLLPSAAQATADPLIGKIFADKYEVISVLGQGGMSIVYKARHKFMDRIVALKLLHEHLVSDELAVQRFQREARAASSLSHHNIVNVHDFGLTASGQAYFVMDCLEGQSLGDIIENDGRLEINKAINIFKQACEGLDHAHKKGVIHRDLKPSNLVLIKQDDGSMLVKIVDFGIAKVMPQQGKPQQQLTQTGEIFGSPLYMSPEQCNGRPMDARSDIYSFGCLMYETLAGVPPIMGDSFINTVVKHVNEAPPSFALSAPDANIPKPIEAVIMKCLAKDPGDRYSTAIELKQSILDAALDSGVQGLRPGAVPDPTVRTALGSTWERVKISLNTDTDKLTKRTFSLVRKIVAAFLIVLLVVLIAGGSFCVMWPGPEGDSGTPWNKWRWTFSIGRAQECIKNKQYDQAKTFLLEAKEITKSFQDDNSRLKFTVELLADVYGKCGMYAEQEQANQEVGKLLTKQILRELQETKTKLRTLKTASESGVQSTMNQLEAEANANRVLLSSKRLYSRGYYKLQEGLLKEAIGVFEHLRIHRNEQVAEFKTDLAGCMIAQQKLTAVRPLLQDALKIRQEQFDEAHQDSIKKLIQSYLKIGQFDRDQSDYAESKQSLETAMSMTKKYFSKDNTLKSECLNSYAELLRQTGHKEEAKAMFAEASTLNQAQDDDSQDSIDDPYSTSIH